MNFAAAEPNRALFVDLNEDIYDRHGVYALSASLKKEGIETSYLCGVKHEPLIQQIVHQRPRLVMYSSFSHTLNAYRCFDAELKKHLDVVSVIGGAGATFNPSYIDSTTINAACIGEGDHSLPQFIANGFGATKNIHLSGVTSDCGMLPLVNLDSLPFPDRDAVYSADPLRAKLPSKQFISGRGCPYLCTYCFNHTYNNLIKGHGDIIRKKSVEYLCEEILSVKSRYSLPMVVFNDDTFILNRDWLFRFADQYPRKVGIPYSCNIRANLVNEEVIRALKESGCVAVNWSIEAGDEPYRNTILKRNITDEQILNSAELLNRYGINHRIGNLIGLPGETNEQIAKTIELNIKAQATCSLVNIFVPYPGLDLTKYAISAGYCEDIPEDELPQNFFSRSAMNITPKMNSWLKRLVYLFPLFAKYPRLYYNQALNRFLFRLPAIVLRAIYEIFFGVMFRKLYRVNSSLGTTMQLFWRHLRSLVG